MTEVHTKPKVRVFSGRRISVGCVVVMVAYLGFWPVPIEPVAWTSPHNPSNESKYKIGRALDGAAHLDVGSSTGPEAVAVDEAGRIYTGVKDGSIMRFDSPDSQPTVFSRLPAGRPLGLAFAANGDLYVAHVPAGLMKVTPDGRSSIVLDSAEGIPIRYADDLDIARDGTVYLSDATTKFDPTRFGGSFMTSRMDLMEHGGHGRLIEYHPRTDRARVVVRGLQFANGVAVTHDDRGVLIVETGSYQLVLWNRDEPDKAPKPVTGPFPGFPDNVTRGRDGRYWVGIVSKRSPILDALSEWPTLRKVAYRLPLWLQPQARSTGFVLGLDAQFELKTVLRGRSNEFGYTVSAVEYSKALILSRLKGESLLYLPNWQTLAPINY